MKNQKLFLFLFAWLLFAGVSVMSSCKKDDTTTATPSADKSKLTALIDSVNLGYTAAVEGTKPGTYAAGSKATLKTSIDLSTGVKNDGGANQTSVNAAIASLRRAVIVFQNSLIQEVGTANLMAQWKFAGNANDATANGNNGTLKTGPAGVAPTFPAAPADGTVLPVLVADRFGRANQAYEFNSGAYIEVPYRIALNPQAMTISAWVKPADSNPDNYIVSMNRWTGYKFQLQGDRKPFLTVSTTNSTTPISDRDAASGIVPVATWSHVVTSYVDGTMKFYINGALVKTWTDVSGTIRAVAQPVNLCIGQQLPKNIYNSAPTAGQAADYFQYYAPAYFKGQMDDIRIYNRALTDAEVQSIYTIENTL